MADTVSYGAVFLIGLLGGAHCIGMCGGIVNALSFAISPVERSSVKLNFILLSYNLGRISSYTIIGVLVGALGWIAQEALGPVSFVMRIIAGILLVTMGLYLTGWWTGLRKLEKLGGYLWVYIEPAGKRLMPVNGSGQAFVLGAIWGWLPCGMVYSVLTLAAVGGNSWNAGLLMLFFGLGTLPVMLVTGRFAQVTKRFLQTSVFRNVAGVLILLFGLWTMTGAIYFSGKHNHSNHVIDSEMSMPGHSHH